MTRDAIADRVVLAVVLFVLCLLPILWRATP